MKRTNRPTFTMLEHPIIDAPIGASTPNAAIPNPRGYPPFDLHQVPSYTNRQLRYYQFSSATLDTDTNDLKKRLDERKATLKALD